MIRLPRPRDLPLAVRERLLRVASLACAAVVVGATALHAHQLSREIDESAQLRLKTVSRILGNEVNRALLQTRGLLDQVDDALRDPGPMPSTALQLLLEAMPRQQALLREIAVVDRSGRVVASSSRTHVGADVSDRDFARRERDGRLHVGGPNAGRGLAPGAARGEGPEHAHDGFLTVSRTSAAHPEAPLVVAVIGTASLVNDLKYLSGEDERVITVYRYDGRLLAASDPAPIRRATPHPIFADFLPDRETGDFVDVAGGRTWIARFDTTADFPVVVEVRSDRAAIVAHWRSELVAPGLILLVTLGAVAVYTRMTAGALRARQRSQAQAATQERRMRNILETAADGIVTMDGRGIVRDYNRAAEAIFGVPAAEAIGRPLADLLPVEHARRHQAHVEGYLVTGRASVIGRGRTISTRRRDGRPLELHLAVSEVVDQGERLFTGIVRDVTEVRQAEQRFRTLFQRSGEPHLLFDSSGLVDCNDAAAGLLRAPGRDALVRRSLADLAPPAQAGGPSAEVLAAAVDDARRDGVRRLVWTARALDGTECPVEMTLTPIRLGPDDAMLVAWHDISERQRHEAELRRARDAAESAAAAKAQFLAMMSHELRTPMTGIIGMIDLLHDSRMTDEQRRFVDVLRGSAQSLLTVLDDVLDYSKIEAGRLQLERIDFRPAAVAREVVELLSHSASQRGNALALRWDGDPATVLAGDPTRLRQVLFNLVGNAIKFTERGSISIRGSARPRADGRVGAAFEVADTGVGIAPDVLPTLFRPFQQADSSTTRRFGGTGLGLAICRHLVEAMGGTIGVDSRPGEGSTFRFEVVLDAGRASAAPEASPEPDAPQVRGLRILVAEDNPTNRLLIGTRLRRASHHVDLVENGLKAVDAVRAHDYDVVLMDMQMPELDGAGATRAIRALPGDRGRVPIVALTADALPEFRERYMSSGLDEYLTKPIDWRALDRVLRRYAPRPATPADPGGARGVPGPAAVGAGAPPAGPGPGVARPDEAGVVEMREDLGEDVWALVLEVYWPKADADVAAIGDAVRAGDATARRAAAHSLKGASSSVGFATVARIAAALEHCGGDEAVARLAELGDAYRATRDAWAAEPVAAT